MTAHPIPPHVTQFAVGVVTAARPEYTLPGTLRSLAEAGFDELHVFAEPSAPLEDIGEAIVIRRPETIARQLPQITPQPDGDDAGRFGCWQNALQSLADLLELKPDAQAVMLVQDDVTLAPGAREFLASDLWPADPVGLVSLYTPSNQQRDDSVGCHRRGDWGRNGACCNVYPRHVVEQLLAHPIATNWQGRPRKADAEPWTIKADDSAIGSILRAMHLPAFSYVPSLVDHVAAQSSLGNGSNRGNRNARDPLKTDVLAHWTAQGALPASTVPTAPNPAHPRTRKLNRLAVVCCHFNPAGYAAPVANLDRFLAGMKRQNVDVHLVHAKFPGNRSLTANGATVAEILIDNPERQALWQKERLLNHAAFSLPDEFDALAWIDADILLPDDWLDNTLEQLRRFPVVQLWRNALQELPDGSTVAIEKPSVGSAVGRLAELRLDRVHPGFAWAMRREEFNACGGLLESMVTGGGDGLIAAALSGKPLSRGVLARLSPAWLEQLRKYNRRAAEAVRGPLGCVDQTITHLWHGSRENRRYLERWDYLARDQFDPDADLEVTESGLLQWTEHAMSRKREMVEQVAGYFAQRREDDDR